MSVNKVNSDGSLLRVAGGTLYADAPIGTISPFGGSTIPNGYLLCDGQAVSRTTYAELFATIGTAFGTGNGSTTFNVPDLRETVPVGTGTRESGVADHDTYTLGQFKDDQMQKIDGTFRALSGNVSNPFYEKSVVSETYAGSSTSSRIIGFDTSRSARTGATTHGKQLGVNYIIKAKQVAVPFDLIPTINKGEIVGKLDYGLGYTKNVYSIATTYTGEITTGQSLGVINDIDRIISIDGTFIQDGDPVKYRQFPYQDQYGYTATIEIQRVSTTSFRIVVYKSDNWTLRDANIMVLYTKTTD